MKSETAGIKPILLFGGRFDPIHNGHLIAAREVKEKLGFEEVIFIPSAVPPHKPAKASFSQRVDMVRLAIKNEPGFDISVIEGYTNAKSYTVDTVRTFSMCGFQKISWLIGTDNVYEIHKWHKFDELCKLCEFVVVKRPFEVEQKTHQIEHIACEIQEMPHSSTEIRDRRKQGKSIQYLTTDAVVQYILTHNLYKD